MRIYTKTGDAGVTSLFGGTKIDKDSLRVWCYGTVDELVCELGVVVAYVPDWEHCELIRDIQKKLFVIGAELASDESGVKKLKEKISDDDVFCLEGIIDSFSEKQMIGFTTPGKNILSAHLHVARATTRKAERFVVALSKKEPMSELILQYLNRLSDLLYVLSEMA